MKQGTNLCWVSVAVIALGCATACSARGDQNPTFAKANQDYSEGHFQEAVDGYRELVKSGQWSANLFYDLGNAWFRLGNFGEAILNYLRDGRPETTDRHVFFRAVAPHPEVRPASGAR